MDGVGDVVEVEEVDSEYLSNVVFFGVLLSVCWLPLTEELCVNEFVFQSEILPISTNTLMRILSHRFAGGWLATK